MKDNYDLFCEHEEKEDNLRDKIFCDIGKHEILEDDFYYVIEGNKICSDCIDDFLQEHKYFM